MKERRQKPPLGVAQSRVLRGPRILYLATARFLLGGVVGAS
jgi:hypothetical protein